MNTSENVRHPYLARFVESAGHPLFLAGALAFWLMMGRDENALLGSLLAALIAMALLEWLVPAVPQWRQSGGEKLRLVGVYLLILVFYGFAVAVHEAVLLPALSEFRTGLGSAIWPVEWPILMQVLMLYFASDFIYYWIHRAIHRSSILWRLTGHGFHHAFHNMHAINSGANHPFDILFVALPLVLVASLFGAPGEAVAGASVLLVVNATLAHANVSMETPGFSSIFTASNQHRRHHSAVFEESNTNYACNAIVWDRLFGTYSSGAVQQTGIGPQQPALWRMFMLPFREPEGVDTVSTRINAQESGRDEA